jgi:dihydrodipicolinate synthase/N-acetylneuraminate lyase
VIAGYREDPDWERVRPPLLPLTQEQKRTLLAELQEIGFEL